MSQSTKENSQNKLEDFSYKAIHDLKAPLRGIDSFIKLLDKKNKDSWDEKDIKYIGFVQKSTTKMQNLVQDLLNFMKVSLHNHQTEELNLEDLVTQVYDELRDKNENAKFICSKLPTIKGPKLIYELLFSNLLDNALIYVKVDKTPVVEIKCDETEKNWEFSVIDNGIGIDSDDFETIFEPLERLHSDTQYPGTGLGLAICKRITELLGGTISLTSIIDEGSVFTVSIPKL